MPRGRRPNPDAIKTCRIADCDGLTGGAIRGTARGLCRRHYSRWQRHGDPLKGARQPRPYGGVCAVAGCDREARVRGCCRVHSQRLYRNGGDPHAYRRGRAWTADEDAALLRLPVTSRARVVVSGYLTDAAAHLDRTVVACRSRLYALRNARARAAAG